MKIAILSNINMKPVERLLSRECRVYASEGYGNELGVLLDPASSYHAFAPDITFLVVDLMELLGHDTDPRREQGNPHIREWLDTFEGAVRPGGLYYLSDACLWGPESALVDGGTKAQLEMQWLEGIRTVMDRHSNVRLFPYCQIVSQLGEENSFSLKMWYLGKILHTGEAQKRIAAKILEKVKLEQRVPKKVLVLDLDNTLWGGLAGENDHDPIQLSEDHTGLCYKNLQRVILYMQQAGVLLAIASKNNEADALEIIGHHPHMVLGQEAFAAKRINWNQKNVSLAEIAQELNLGTDSFVFWDDSAAERELIRQTMPEVTVPEFPERPEELAPAMCEIYKTYFEKAVVTGEDRAKTKQYADNARRTQLRRSAVSFEEYLRQLQIHITSVEPAEHMDRFCQLVNKTNQFNLTTRRYDVTELQKIVEELTKKVYLYRIEDRFGDYGIVAAAIVDLTAPAPDLEEFVLSCRVMGKNIEDTILKEIETDLKSAGFQLFRTSYIPTPKNKPVENLFERLGYTVLERGGDGSKRYEKRI